MPTASLYDMALKKCIRSHARIYNVGALPYSTVRPILKAIDTAQQLREIEVACPQIMGDDAELWLSFIKRDIPKDIRDSYEDISPTNPENWHKVYRTLKRQAEKKAQAAKAAFGQKMNEANKAKQALHPQALNVFKDKLPKVRKQVAAPPRRKTDLGKSLLSRMRTEAKNQAPGQRVMINTSYRAQPKKTVVSKPPIAMLEDYRMAAAAGTRTKPESASSAVQQDPSRTIRTGQDSGKKTVAVERRKLSEAEYLNMGVDGPDESSQKKRPALHGASLPAAKRAAGNIFMQPQKRRKLG